MDRPQKDYSAPRTPWEELAVQAARGPAGGRAASAHKDRAVLSALRGGSPARRLSDLLSVSVQAIYQAAERAEAGENGGAGDRHRGILAALREFTDAVKFEQLACDLLGQFIPDLRPTQRSGDRGRDAVAGEMRAVLGEELVVTISLAKDWSRKIGADMKRLAEQGLSPRRVYAVTNRETDERRLQRLHEEAQGFGWGLTVFDAGWLTNQLVQPQSTALARDYLGLAAPRPAFFIDAAEFERLLAEIARVPQVPFVGRDGEASRLIQALGSGKTIILQAPGGMGKSRLLSKVALQGAWRWLFVRAGMPFSPDSLSETGSGKVVVVIDDAHRREDRRSLLAALEQRTPRPLVVLACRPGFADEIRADLDGLAFGPAEQLDLGPLPRPELARMLEEPPLEVRYGGLRTAIVELSQGNPQIASIAADLSAQGLAIHELRGGEVMRAYAGAVLREAAEGGRERISLMALVAAAGTLSLGEQDSGIAGELLGLPRAHLRRDVADLADRGLLVEQDGIVSIKPDVLAEHVLVGCFFDRGWDPALDYADVYEAFAPGHRLEMLSALGQAFNSAPEPTTEIMGRLDCVRRDLLSEELGAGSIERTTDALAALAPGLPDLALEGFDRLLADLNAESESQADLWSRLLGILSRVSRFDESWKRMLELARRLFASHNFEDPVVDSRPNGPDGWRRSLKAFNEAFAEIHRRLPVDSPGDGRMLAGVQEQMAHLTASWWRSEGSKTGAPEAALLAAGSLLTVFYEGSIPDAANPRQINLMSFAVPATGSTKRSFTTGFEILSAAMPRLSIRGQLRALESLRSVAHPALGFAGPFGLEVSEETRTMINDFFEAAVIPWLADAIREMPLPVAAAAMELAEWRAHFGESPPVQIEIGQQLRDYRELFEPGEGWRGGEHDPDELGYQRVVADRHARRLVEDSDPQPRLVRWAEWYELQILATGGKPHGPMLGMLFQRVVELNRTRGVEVIELLVAAESPLLGHAAVAIGNVLNDDPSHADAWIKSRSTDARAALARATIELEDEDRRRAILEVLAEDPARPVREAVAVALRYGSALTDWQLDLVLLIFRKDRLGWLLEGYLRELADADAGSALRGDQLKEIEAAVLRTAELAVDNNDDLAVDLLEAARKLGRDLVWPWIWHRLDQVGPEQPLTRLDERPLPGAVIRLAGQDTDGSQAAEIAARLEQTSAAEWRREEALIRLAVLVDDGNLAARLASWVQNGGSDEQRRLRRVMQTPMSWERYERYAAAVLAVDPSQQWIETVVSAREPTSFIGSRVAKYEAALDGFAQWESSSDGNLVRAAHFARDYFEGRIAEAREGEQQWLSHYGP